MGTMTASPVSEFDLTQIIDGVEVMTASPFGIHQKILGYMYRKMADYIESRGLGEVFVSPLDVILEEGYNKVQPDIIFIKKDNMRIFQDFIRGIPDLVVEIVSQGSFTLDTVKKKELYERYGVFEYWIVIPELRSIDVFVLEGAKYKLFSFAEIEGKVHSSIIEGFEVNVKEIFMKQRL